MVRSQREQLRRVAQPFEFSLSRARVHWPNPCRLKSRSGDPTAGVELCQQALPGLLLQPPVAVPTPSVRPSWVRAAREILKCLPLEAVAPASEDSRARVRPRCPARRHPVQKWPLNPALPSPPHARKRWRTASEASLAFPAPAVRQDSASAILPQTTACRERSMPTSEPTEWALVRVRPV